MSNTQIRSVSGLVFVVIFVWSLLASPVIFTMVMLLSVLVMTKEFTTISNGNNYPVTSKLVMLASAAIYALFYFYYSGKMDSRYFWLLAPVVASIPISILYGKDQQKKTITEGYHKSAFFMMAPIYIALPFALTNLILFDSQYTYAPKTLVSLFVILWSCDVGAYVFGMAFGQKNGHKLFPSISPKKSWEGFFGGLVAAMVSGIILFYTNLLQTGLIHVVAISAIVFVFSVLGDLSESLFKRNFGVKDSGSIMPGHGGLLDRFDGALIAFPVAIAYIKLFQLI